MVGTLTVVYQFWLFTTCACIISDNFVCMTTARLNCLELKLFYWTVECILENAVTVGVSDRE